MNLNKKRIDNCKQLSYKVSMKALVTFPMISERNNNR